MNSNLFRTLLTWAAAVILIVPVFIGCVALTTGSFDCSQSWLPPWASGVAAIVLLGLGMLVKAMDGTGLFKADTAGFRTFLTIAAIVVTGAVSVFGCTVTAVGFDCSASWIGPQGGALLGGVLLGLNQLVKTFDGTTLTKPVK